MYEWLRDYQKLEEEITYLEFQVEQTERELKRWVEGDLAKIKLQHDSLGAQVEDNLKNLKDELSFKKEQINRMIQLVKRFKGLENRILTMKYIDQMTLEQIAEELNYSSSYIYKKHAEIVRMIKFADSLNLSVN